jgi:S1-C subfamily serine protease
MPILYLDTLGVSMEARRLPIAALVSASIALCAGSAAFAQSTKHKRPQPLVAARTAIAAALQPGISFAPMLEKVIPAVVTIRVTGQRPRPVIIPPRQKDGKAAPLPAPEMEEFRSGGSGVIIDAQKGFIITNNHVIENATRIEVGLSNGRRLIAKLLGTDVGSDVAVIQIEEPNLPSIKLGDSDAMRVGDLVVAVGNPFGLEGTATLGIVSALMRTEIGHGLFEDYMQIDALINPGNSGGALVNSVGELIGMNSVAGGSKSQTFGIGFAVPINMAKVIVDELVAAGRMRRGSTGLVVDDLPAEFASPQEGVALRGAIVQKVVPKSPAAAVGIEAGDIVVSANNKPVRSAGEFITRTVTVPLGSTIPLILFAKGHGRLVSVTLEDMVVDPDETVLKPEMGSLAGAVVGDIVIGNRLFGDVQGAQILRLAPDSPAYKIGLEPDDVIVNIDEAKVRSAEELVYRVSRANKEFQIAIVRDGVPGLVRGTH